MFFLIVVRKGYLNKEKQNVLPVLPLASSKDQQEGLLLVI